MCAHRKRSTRNIAGTLDSTHPDLAAQWHPKKNEGLAPSDVSYGSGKKVWWLGDCGHSWQAAISNRVRSVSRVCPRCSDNRKSTRNLKDTHPDIAKQWHPDKNKDLTPEDVSHGSGKKVWWLGDCGHKWKAEIRNRARGAGCPVCSGLQVLVGFNDLASTDPRTAQWWNTAKNGDVRPTDVTRRSAKKVWWKCPNGHEWKRSVSAMRAAGCPKCDHTLGVRVPHEESGYVRHSGRHGVIPLSDLLVSQWHPTKNGKLQPRNVSGGSGRKVWWKCTKGHSWKATIASRSNGAGCPVCNAVSSESEKEVLAAVKELTDMKVLHNVRGGFLGRLELDIYIPDSALGIEFNGEYWHNTSVFEHIAESHRRKQSACSKAGVRLVVVWEKDWNDNREEVISQLRDIIESGADTPKSMTYGARETGIGVPGSGVVLHNPKDRKQTRQQPHERSVDVYAPHIAAQWHPTKNGDLTPRDVTYGSVRKVWWICDEGHEWQASVYTRAGRGYGCPRCHRKAGTPVADSTNYTFWHTSKNHDLDPAVLTTGSFKKAWWKCPRGHEWQEKIAGVARRKSACPYCAKEYPAPRKTTSIVKKPKHSLLEINPDLAAQWHPTLNGDLIPSMVSCWSKRKAWWLCSECGREWEGVVKQRVRSPLCSRCHPRRGRTKGNPLSPQLVSQWHPTKNEWMTPSMVTAGSGKKVWWLGECGHEWQAIIAQRTAGTGCPECARWKRCKWG